MKLVTNWIWIEKQEQEFNNCVLARKVFDVKSKPESAKIAITADTRYRLYVNGKWINDGPVRSFPWKYSYDLIDISKYLKIGTNILVVVIYHWGENTFQSSVVRGGLLTQLELKCGDNKTIIVSDSSWKMSASPFYNIKSPRASFQLGFEEQYDARKLGTDWMDVGFDDSNWQQAVCICDTENGPWKNLTCRNIPFLALEEVRPKRLVNKKNVCLPQIIWTCRLRKILWQSKLHKDCPYYRSVLFLNIVSDAIQTSQFFKPVDGEVRCIALINGVTVDFAKDFIEKERIEFKLKKGINPLAIIFNCPHNQDEFQLIIDAKENIKLENPFGQGKFAFAGPFEIEDPVWSELCRTSSAERFYTFKKHFKTPLLLDIVDYDVHAETCRQIRTMGEPVVYSAYDMYSSNAEQIRIKKGSDCEIILDFGSEFNMYIGFEISAPQGVTIDFNVFERYLDGEPQWTVHNRSGFRYITRDGEQSFINNRSLGGRYLAVTFRNISSDVYIENIYGLFKHYPVLETGKFLCSDPILNKIWEISKRTILCCMEDTFTDCPAYEQAYWVGDGRVEALVSASAFGGVEPLIKRCVELAVLSLERSDMIDSQVPTGIVSTIPVWSFLWVKMCREYLLATNDVDTIKKIYPGMSKMLGLCLTKYMNSNTGLFEINAWNFLDWTPMDIEKSCVTHNNIFLYEALRDAMQIAKELGDSTQAVNLSNAAEKLKNSINNLCWSESKGAYIDSINSDGVPSKSVSRPVNTLALLYDLASEDKISKILPIVKNQIKDGIVPFGSPFAIQFLLEYYAKKNEIKLMIDTIVEYWSKMIDGETTTFWESFGDIFGDKFPSRSYCHAWSAGPAYLLSRFVTGVSVTEPGAETVKIKPQLLLLDWVEGVVPTVKGNVEVNWKRYKDNLIILKIYIPQDVSACLVLPDNLKIEEIVCNNQQISKEERSIKLADNITTILNINTMNLSGINK